MNKAYYAIIPANVRYDSNLKDKAKLLYGEITALCNEQGFCWATNDYFAQLYSINKLTVSRLISDLKNNGYIQMQIMREGKQVKERRIYISQNRGIDQIVNRGIDRNINRGIDQIVKDNNTSINNNIYSRIVDYLNKKAGTSYRVTTKKTKQLISARFHEGFKEEDFFKVVDNKCKEWLNSEYEKFIRPETLFGNKFEGYLNQKPIKNITKSTSSNYEAFPL